MEAECIEIKNSTQNSDVVETVEEIYVRVVFPDFNETKLIFHSEVVRLEGLFSEAPKCYVGDLEFTGQHLDSIGTIAVLYLFK